MKCHVFIATTQGLVAVQDIELIDDPDVMSIVCLNGTAQSLNISNAYHNFVKKGSGIIQKDFKGQSYRVDVSDNIDHGNSWQLGFYIAHFLASVDLLGDGKPNEDDQIFCLTGEVNIKDKSVKNVEHIITKLALAQTQIKDWQSSGFEAKFLLPEQNKLKDELIPYKGYCFQVANLASAISQLPSLNKDLVKSTSLIKQTPNRFNKRLISAFLVRNKKLVSVVILSALFLFFFINLDMHFENNEQVNDDVLLNKISQTTTAQIIKPYLVAHERKTTYLNTDNKKCEGSLSINRLDVKNDRFKSLAYEKLCQLYLVTPQNIKQVIMFSRYKKEIIKLQASKNTWPITLPNKLNNDLYYLLLPLSLPLSEAQILSLNNEIKNINGSVTITSVSPILKLLSINESLIKHKIMTF